MPAADLDIGVIYTHEQGLMPPLMSSLCRSGDDLRMRLILVDNASTEGVSRWAACLPGTLVLRNERRLGYSPNLNRIVTLTNLPPQAFFKVLGPAAQFAGAQSCAECHEDIYLRETGTPHAHALTTLKTAGQGANASCLPCHTVGFGLPTGFSTEAATPHLAGVQCESCHGPKGEGTVQLPRLAGQHAAYLQSQLKEFNTRERTNDNAVMHAIASKLTELEIRAVAVYLSGQL